MSMSESSSFKGISNHRLIVRALALTAALCLTAVSAGCGAKGAEDKADDSSKLSFMLDWTPNTNHVGIYVARHLGYFDKAGLKLTILPTAQAGAETSVQNGVADVGFSKLSNLATFNSQGADSGTNTFATLTSGKGDFAGFYANWEGVESELKGPALHCFTQADWGVPGNPDQLGFVVKNSWLQQESHRRALTAFVKACLKGYNYALSHPDQAADILVQETKGSAIDPTLAKRSMESIVKEGYWVDSPDQKNISGLINVKDAQDYLDFQFKAGTYRDAKKGDPNKAPQASDLWTDRYVREAAGR